MQQGMTLMQPSVRAFQCQDHDSDLIRTGSAWLPPDSDLLWLLQVIDTQNSSLSNVIEFPPDGRFVVSCRRLQLHCLLPGHEKGACCPAGTGLLPAAAAAAPHGRPLCQACPVSVQVSSTLSRASDQRLDFHFTGAALKLPKRSIKLPPFGKGW